MKFDIKSNNDKKKIIITSFIIFIIFVVTISFVFICYNKLKKNNSFVTDMTVLKKNESLYIKIINDQVNVRSTESVLPNNKVGDVYKNDVFKVNDIKKGSAYYWYYISDIEGNVGYIASSNEQLYVETIIKNGEDYIDLSTIKNYLKSKDDSSEQNDNKSINKNETEKNDSKNGNEIINNKHINKVNITLNNWKTYFEIKREVEWDYNSFKEVKGMALSDIFQIKKEFHGKIAKESEIALETKGIKIDKLLIPDYINKKYKLENKTWDGGLGSGMDFSETKSLVLYPDNKGKQSVIIHWCHDGYYINNDELKIITIDVIENLNVTRIQGLLYLYD